MIAESTTFYMLGWIDHIRPINLSSELGLLGSPNKDERVEQSTQAGWTYLLNKSTQPDSLKVDFLKKKKWLGPAHHELWVKRVGGTTNPPKIKKNQ